MSSKTLGLQRERIGSASVSWAPASAPGMSAESSSPTGTWACHGGWTPWKHPQAREAPDGPEQPGPDGQRPLPHPASSAGWPSVLATTTILHLSAGLIVAAVFIDDEHRASQIGLCLIAGAFGVIAVGVGLAIHGRRPLSPWLLMGLAVAGIGLAVTFG